MKVRFISIFIYIFTGTFSFCNIQSYIALLNRANNNEGEIKVQDISFISYGFVDNNYILLNKIAGTNSGNIIFTINSVSGNVKVGFEEWANSATSYFFKFENGNINVLIDNNVVFNVINFNVVTDVFKVEKCGEAIKFYKNSELLYLACLQNPTNELVHKTIVGSANNINLGLTFDDNISASCANNIIVNNSTSSRSNKSRDVTYRLPAKKEVLLNVLDTNSVYIKQIRGRTNANGKLEDDQLVQRYFNENYKIILVSAK